jgi:NADH dehydrogenase FAD-containing subunit
LAQVAEQQGKYLAAVFNAKERQLENAPVSEFKCVDCARVVDALLACLI